MTLLDDTRADWSTITGWSADISGDATHVPQYWVGPNGRVELRGRVNHTTTFPGSGVLVVTLPSGARPAANADFPVARNYSASHTAAGRISVQTDGVLLLYCPAGETSWFSLDGVWFYTS